MGIELPYEGDRLGEYCQRFVDNGNYTQWIHDGWLKDWLILDCRTSSPQPYSKFLPHIEPPFLIDDQMS